MESLSLVGVVSLRLVVVRGGGDAKPPPEPAAAAEPGLGEPPPVPPSIDAEDLREVRSDR
jgi:hypothetical protein